MINYLEQNKEQIEFITKCAACGREVYANAQKINDVWYVFVSACDYCKASFTPKYKWKELTTTTEVVVHKPEGETK